MVQQFRYRFVACLSIILAFLCLSGCTGAVATVSGEVTYNGQPIDDGNIRLDPLGEENETEGASAPIKTGKYEIPASTGLKPGKYRVSITAIGKTGRQLKVLEKLEGEQTDKLDEVIQYIPWEYNRDSTLELEVAPGENPGKNFTLVPSS